MESDVVRESRHGQMGLPTMEIGLMEKPTEKEDFPILREIITMVKD